LLTSSSSLAPTWILVHQTSFYPFYQKSGLLPVPIDEVLACEREACEGQGFPSNQSNT
ncbi:6238_t:CDS:2, partial [Rhizophagus irregularis]